MKCTYKAEFANTLVIEKESHQHVTYSRHDIAENVLTW